MVELMQLGTSKKPTSSSEHFVNFHIKNTAMDPIDRVLNNSLLV